MEENALNVVMIGASRSGKTSILASMLEQITCSSINDYFFINDKSEYSYKESDERAFEVSLSDNVDAMKDLLNPQLNGGKIQPRLTGLIGNSAPFTYDIAIQSITNKRKVEKEVLHVKFTDVPGEYFAKKGKEFDEIEKIIKKSQILLVAVDVPALMYAKEKKKSGINRYMNLPYELITAANLLSQDYNDPDLMRMVAFIPIKCEYWMHHDRMEEVYDEIKKVYANGLARLDNASNIRVMIMPMETIGGLEFDHYSEDNNSYLLIYGENQRARKNADVFIEEDCIGSNGAVRCEKVSENKVRIKNGAIYALQSSDKLILAKERGRHPYVYNEGVNPIAIPFFWFIPTGKGYQPRYCEQALFQVLMFAIESIEAVKENIAKSKKAKSKKAKREIDITELPQKLTDNFVKVNSFTDHDDDFHSLNPFKAVWGFVKAMALFIFLTLRSFGFFSEEQCSRFSENIKRMKEEGIIDDGHIRYLIRKEDGEDLLK